MCFQYLPEHSPCRRIYSRESHSIDQVQPDLISARGFPLKSILNCFSTFLLFLFPQVCALSLIKPLFHDVVFLQIYGGSKS